MVVDVLSPNVRKTMRSSIIAPAHDPCIWNIGREEIPDPVDVVGLPRLLAMPIEAVNGNDAMIKA
jgi:hypothetical protein